MAIAVKERKHVAVERTIGMKGLDVAIGDLKKGVRGGKTVAKAPDETFDVDLRVIRHHGVETKKISPHNSSEQTCCGCCTGTS